VFFFSREQVQGKGVKTMRIIKLILMTTYALIIIPIILISGLVLNLTIGQERTDAIAKRAQDWVTAKQEQRNKK
jgi:hypothetical protein